MGSFNTIALRTRYPLRATRYWLARTALEDEAKRLGRPLTILDMGCGKGISRQYVGDSVAAQWIGLDWRVDSTRLQEIGYDEIAACDFDQSLPLADHCVDAVICLHVLEHLPRPDFALLEIARVLRPGGVVLAATPVAPSWVARWRERQLRRQLRRGQRRSGRHINSFWPARWQRLARAAQLELETLAGGYLLRCAGNPLENSRIWIRLNQIWGAMFPSLGGEVCVKARPIVHAERATRQPAAWLPLRALVVRRLWPRVGNVAAAAVIILGLLLAWPKATACPVGALIQSHQDGDDVFYAVDHPILDRIPDTRGISIIPCFAEPSRVLQAAEAQLEDVHLFVTEDQLHLAAHIHPNFWIVGRTSLGGTLIYLLGAEGYGEPLSKLA